MHSDVAQIVISDHLSQISCYIDRSLHRQTDRLRSPATKTKLLSPKLHVGRVSGTVIRCPVGRAVEMWPKEEEINASKIYSPIRLNYCVCCSNQILLSNKNACKRHELHTRAKSANYDCLVLIVFRDDPSLLIEVACNPSNL